MNEFFEIQYEVYDWQQMNVMSAQTFQEVIEVKQSAFAVIG